MRNSWKIKSFIFQYWGVVYPAFVGIIGFILYLIYGYFSNPHRADFQSAIESMVGSPVDVISIDSCSDITVDLPNALLYKVKEGSSAVECLVTYNLLPADMVLLENYVPTPTKSIISVSKGTDGSWKLVGIY